MKLIEYKYQHYPLLLELLASQNSSIPSAIQPDQVPEIGFIAFQDADCVAIGFLRRVEGRTAMLDTLVSNAEVKGSVRHEGLNAIVEQLIKTAKDLDLLGVFAFTTDKSIKIRAEDTGFKSEQQTILSLNLRS